MNNSILTFNFNGYDTFHSHFYSSDFEYILVTDDISRPMESWNIKYPEVLHNLPPWEKSLYVRYHPFEFVNEKTDILIVIDGSMTICEGIIELADWFSNSIYDLAIPLSHQPNCRDRLSRWVSQNRISEQEYSSIEQYLKESNTFNYKGCLSGSVKLLKNTSRIKEWLENTYSILYQLGINGQPIRLDEVIATSTLNKFNDIKFAPLATRIMLGDALCYTDHRTGCPKKLKWSYPSYYRNNIVKPIYVGKEYTRKYKYKSEAMCLTRYFDEQGLREWISHHLTIGFDHIHIFDNESDYPCKAICDEYGDNVSYELITGSAQHYKIFDEYVNSDRCKSEWVIPIDDDEYFDLNTDVCNSVNECIDWYINKFPYSHMFAIRWRHLFPKVFHKDYDGPVLSYCTEENPKLASSFQRMGDRGIKTFVHRYGKIHYETTEENPSGGHVPKHSAATYALLYNGEKITRCSCMKLPDSIGEPARLIHCRYKGYSWYVNKNNDIVETNRELDNNSGKPYTHYYKFNELLEELE